MINEKKETKPDNNATPDSVSRVVGPVLKPRIRVSFSGGRTSALMTRYVVERYGVTHDIVITFSNTGCEHENTLKFVNQCDEFFGWNVVWLESVFNMQKGKGVKAKIVSYGTASRNGEPFIEYIKKNGLPNMMNPRCSDRLKEHAMDHYTHQQIGWKRGSYLTAIGIRADEIDRVNPNYKERGFIYPLADLGIRKDEVKLALAEWPFDLDLKSEAYGNCVWCWKKSLRKLMTLAKEDESIFNFAKMVEAKYGGHKLSDDEKENRVMFRKKMSAFDIIRKANAEHFAPFIDSQYLQPSLFDSNLDMSLGCGESCEVGH